MMVFFIIRESFKDMYGFFSVFVMIFLYFICNFVHFFLKKNEQNLDWVKVKSDLPEC